MPLNLRIEEILVGKADLLEGDSMPDPFLEVIAHVAAYRTVIKRWDQGDFSRVIASVPFPREDLLPHIKSTFKDLKVEQARLLGLLGP